jgi:hypothetical protein
MTLSAPAAAVLATFLVFFVSFLLYKAIVWTRSKSHNTELWGTVFESLTHYVQPQGSLKEPKQEIVKQKSNLGEDKDKGSSSSAN